ncbi:MAG TPA: hypothetical protein VKB75_13380 [Jatrophihabitans sp.]|nr:hypothetical protein [Jatrophihabitans sp.]
MSHRPELNVAHALNLVRAAAKYSTTHDRRADQDAGGLAYAHFGAPVGVVGWALALAGAGIDELEAMGERSVRELYRTDFLSVGLTLGALVVFDGAQRSERAGEPHAQVLDRATAVATRYVELVCCSDGLVSHHPSPVDLSLLAIA